MAAASTTKSTEAETTGWWRKSCIITKRLEGKLAIVTGSNTGIGAVTAAEMARRGCTVIMACRSIERAQKAKDDIIEKYGASNPDSVKIDVAAPSVSASLSPVSPDQLIIEQIDLGSLNSIREFVKRFESTHKTLDYLINNAGLLLEDYSETVNGFEMNIGVNYLGPFLLTELLLPILRNTGSARIINVSSMGNRWGLLHKPELLVPEKDFQGDKAYYQTKLVNIMHARELCKRLADTDVIAVSLHPGIIKSEFFRGFKTFKMRMLMYMGKPFYITPWMGAQTTMYTVLSDRLVPGMYYDNCAEGSPNPKALNDEDCAWLWNRSAELIEQHSKS